MITVASVRAEADELRPITGGWGGLHWWATLCQAVPYVGLVILTLFASAHDPDDQAFANALVGILIGTFVLWVAARRWAFQAGIKAGRLAPAGSRATDWTLDGNGVGWSSAVSTSRLDWAVIKAVREEKDRFIILVSPNNNPVLPKRQMTDDQIAALKAIVADITASGRLGAGVDYVALPSDKIDP